MPEFFPFIPGTETNPATSRNHADTTSPLLGRFRAVPPRTTVPSSSVRSIFSVPRWQQRQRSRSNLEGRLNQLSAAGGRGSVHVGYGALIAAGLADENDEVDEDWSSDEDDDDNGQKRRQVTKLWRRTVRKTRRNVEDLWVAPRHNAVRRVVETWWSRWALLVFLPAALVSCVSSLFGLVLILDEFETPSIGPCIGPCVS
jgi:hypothetical protein